MVRLRHINQADPRNWPQYFAYCRQFYLLSSYFLISSLPSQFPCALIPYSFCNRLSTVLSASSKRLSWQGIPWWLSGRRGFDTSAMTLSI
jgi:hypothetical protein